MLLAFEGQGDLVSEVKSPINHIVRLVIPIINLLTQPTEPSEYRARNTKCHVTSLKPETYTILVVGSRGYGNIIPNYVTSYSIFHYSLLSQNPKPYMMYSLVPYWPPVSQVNLKLYLTPKTFPVQDHLPRPSSCPLFRPNYLLSGPYHPN